MRRARAQGRSCAAGGRRLSRISFHLISISQIESPTGAHQSGTRNAPIRRATVIWRLNSLSSGKPLNWPLGAGPEPEPEPGVGAGRLVVPLVAGGGAQLGPPSAGRPDLDRDADDATGMRWRVISRQIPSASVQLSCWAATFGRPAQFRAQHNTKRTGMESRTQWPVREHKYQPVGGLGARLPVL